MTSLRIGTTVPNRGCGQCTVCCRIPEISDPELTKPAGEPCINLSKHIGCSIYESRPATCKTWLCLWRELSWLTDECRPDRLGIFFNLESTEDDPDDLSQTYIVGRTTGNEGAYNSPLARKVFDAMLEYTSL